MRGLLGGGETDDVWMVEAGIGTEEGGRLLRSAVRKQMNLKRKKRKTRARPMRTAGARSSCLRELSSDPSYWHRRLLFACVLKGV